MIDDGRDTPLFRYDAPSIICSFGKIHSSGSRHQKEEATRPTRNFHGNNNNHDCCFSFPSCNLLRPNRFWMDGPRFSMYTKTGGALVKGQSRDDWITRPVAQLETRGSANLRGIRQLLHNSHLNVCRKDNETLYFSPDEATK